jgi:sugar lactone lactonase YvrE
MKKIIFLLCLICFAITIRAQVITTIAGSVSGNADGIGLSAQFNFPFGICRDAAGNIFVADNNNNRIRKITSTGVVTTLAGSTVGFADGIGLAAQFNMPYSVCLDGLGNIYVADSGNHKIRKITPNGIVSTFAGSTQGFTNGTGVAAKFNFPSGVCSDASGNIYVGDRNNNVIRKISPSGVVTTFAGSGDAGNANGIGTSAQFSAPKGICIDVSGDLYVADSNNFRIRKITSTGSVSTFAGSTFGFVNGLSSIAKFNEPSDVCIDNSGNVYVSDSFNNVIRKINTSGTVSTLVTNQLNFPYGICSDILGNLIISDAGNNSIKLITVCNASNNINLNISPTSSNGICIGNSLTLTASGGTSYLWSNGSATSSITVNPSTTSTYSVTATNIYGCTATASKTVTVNPLPSIIITPISPITCSGQNITLTASGGTSYVWNNGAIGSSVEVAPTATTTYSVTGTDANGCSATASKTVNIYSTPTTSISADGGIATSTTINNGSSVQLQLNGSLNAAPNIQWTPALGISSTTVANPLVYPSSTTTYTASFINSNGCPQSTSITVNVTPQPNIGNLSLNSPNTSPIGLFDTITVNVQLTNATDLYSLYMKLKGNAAVSQYLDYSGYVAGNLLGTSNVISTPPTVTNGVPDFGMTKVGAVPGYSGSGLFYTFTFVPKNIVIPDGTVFCFYLDDVNSYNSSATACGLTNQGQICFTFTNQVKVWPGDLNNSNMVTTADLLPIGYFYNSTGPVRPNATIQWTGQPATLWGYNRSTMNGSAYKTFADSNGDGVINNADQAAIGFNMNQVHNRQSNNKPFGIAPNLPNSQQALGTLVVAPNVSVINGATLPQTVTFNVNLNNTGGLTALYGISVNLIFDNTIFDLSTATINYSGSIFGNVGTDCLAMNYNSNTGVSVGLTRFANAAINGNGLLFKVTLQTRTTLPNLSTTQVTSYVDSANNQLGEVLEINDSSPIDFTVINNNLSVDENILNYFNLYPNPTNGLVYFSIGNSSIDFNELKLKVFNTLGQFIEQIDIKTSTFEIDAKSWGASGLYFTQILNNEGKMIGIKKIMLQ